MKDKRVQRTKANTWVNWERQTCSQLPVAFPVQQQPCSWVGDPSPEDHKGAADIVPIFYECKIHWENGTATYKKTHKGNKCTKTHATRWCSYTRNNKGPESSRAGMTLLQRLWRNLTCLAHAPLCSLAGPSTLTFHRSLTLLRGKENEERDIDWVTVLRMLYRFSIGQQPCIDGFYKFLMIF